MSKTFLITLLFTIFGFREVIAQSAQYSTESSDSTNLYHKSLTEFCKYVDHVFPKVHTLSIENSVLAAWLPKKLGKFEINYMEQSEINKKNKKARFIIRIVPVRVKDNVFFINIIPFQIENLEKGKFTLVNSGVMQVNFRYEPSTSNFTFIGVEGGFGKLE